MPDQAIPGTAPLWSPESGRRLTFHRRGAAHETPRLAVPIDEAAAMLGVSYMTLWRAIRASQFPGLQLRGRIIVPLKAVDLLLDTAVQTGELIDTVAWTANWRANTLAEEPGGVR